MARKANGENKSAAIRDLLAQNPDIKAKEVVSTLGQRGLKVAPGLFYFIKGKIKGTKGRGRKTRRRAASVIAGGEAATVKTQNDVVGTIRKVKNLATEIGGIKKLRDLLEALLQ